MTVHSEDRQTWLTKLDRIGNLSASNKDIVFNNIGHLITEDMLKEQYQKLNWRKAIGIDGVTKATYGENLEGNIKSLITRIRRGAYKPKPARKTEIPKEDGSTRPLVISCFEDKLVQLVISTILTKIYEPLFLPCSYGFRAGRSCHDALRVLNKATFKNQNGAIVEIDIMKYFNTIPHKVLLEILNKKISDRRLLRLIDVLITSPIIEGKHKSPNRAGCSQGSILSPVLSNIFLHHVLDKWFDTIKHTHIRGYAEEIRYCDDMVFVFEKESEAKRFYKALVKRLNKFGLEIHEEKSSVLPAGHVPALRANKERKRLPTFSFLGFTCYWGKSRKGFWRLKYTSRRDRFTMKLKSMRQFMRRNLNAENSNDLLKQVIRVIRGWINYHGISDNQRRVNQFLQESERIIFWWFNRRGRKRPLTWEKFKLILKAIGFPRNWNTISMF